MVFASYKGTSIPVFEEKLLIEYCRKGDALIIDILKAGVCLNEEIEKTEAELDIMERVWREGIEKFYHVKNVMMDTLYDFFAETCEILLPVGINAGHKSLGMDSFDVYSYIWTMHIYKLVKLKIIDNDDKNGFTVCDV